MANFKLLDTGEIDYINLDLVATITSTNQGGKWITSFRAINGKVIATAETKDLIPISIDEALPLVPAAPGSTAVVFIPEGDEFDMVETPIVAWRVHSGIGTNGDNHVAVPVFLIDQSASNTTVMIKRPDGGFVD
jgi:hypothetical protein